MVDSQNNPSFYWRTARDSLLTPNALTMFQIALKYDGQSFNQSKAVIDKEYETAKGRSDTQRHGGNFSTFVRVFEEAGWMYVDYSVENDGIIWVTPAGRQAEQLLIKNPDFFKAIPYFLLELLSRFQLNNPAGPRSSKNQTIRETTAESNVFPYWTIWKIMRSCDNKLRTDELKRFVFRLQKTENIEETIRVIKEYRQDKANGLLEDDLNTKYPQPLAGAIGEPKFVMPRAGGHIGKQTPLIIKPDANTYQLNSVYFPLIDEVLKNEPTFGDHLDRETWFKDYGEPVVLEEQVIPFSASAKDLDDRLEYRDVPDSDPVWIQIKDLIDSSERNILFIGPPGTSKTTYALKIGARLAERFPYRFNNVQFHQSFGYEDFMQGYIPAEDSGQSGGFVLRDKVFLHACSKARQETSNKLHVFVIDELNRGDPSRIFGEALTYVERRDETFKLPSGRTVIIPANLVILATMNPYDKSIADLDMAMDRRFAKIFMNPDVRLLKEILIQQNGMDGALAGKVFTFFNFLNKEVENRIGHAYFKDARDLASLRKAWQYKVLPFVEKELRYKPDKRTQIVNTFEASFSDASPET